MCAVCVCMHFLTTIYRKSEQACGMCGWIFSVVELELMLVPQNLDHFGKPHGVPVLWVPDVQDCPDQHLQFHLVSLPFHQVSFEL